MSPRLATAWPVSILATTIGPSGPTARRMVATSSAVRTNDTATASTPAVSTISSMRRSSSVGDRRGTRSSGSDTPGRPRTTPPLSTARDDAVAGAVFDDQRHPAVAQGHPVAGRERVDGTGQLDGHDLGRAHIARHRLGEPHQRAGLESHAVGGERRAAHLGPGEVDEDAHRPAHHVGGRPHTGHAVEARLDGTVGETQPSDVRSRLEQPPQHVRRIRGRSDGGDDLGPTGHPLTLRRGPRRPEQPWSSGAQRASTAATATLSRRWSSTLAARPVRATSTWTPPASNAARVASVRSSPTSMERALAP